jgi:bifunctional UDP-N-acetylglucosamine pyrophosphorylase/glucosamine-1-phosphate N-acetyltransferase
MANGVRFIGAETSFVSPDAKIGEGSVILPNTIIKGACSIGRKCKIGPNSVINCCAIGEGTEINASQVNESTIGTNVRVGPFAYIRPGCNIANDIRIGDFVELKKAKIGDGTKISHLTYVGDADVGKSVNFGCGTVTANYDGVAKHMTVIEDGAFIGCNTNLIAPVKVGKNATTAAGTTVTADVPEGSLAIGRVRQTVKPDWNKYRKK